MKRGTSTLGRCGHLLDQAAVMCADDVCTDCRSNAIVAAQRRNDPAAARESDEWRIFVAALRQAARDGVVRQNDVRPLIRGRIYHKHIGSFYTKAKSTGVLVELHREDSRDTVGRNTHHASGVYRLGDAA